MANLSPKQLDYCHAYVKCRGNVSQAAKASDYTVRYAFDLMQKPEVQDKIVELQLQAAEAAGVDAAEVIGETKALAFSDITDILTIGPDGGLVLRGNLEDLPREVRITIKSIEVKETATKVRGSDDEEMVRRTVKITLHDKIDPLKLLAIYTSAVVGGKPGSPPEGDEGAWTGVQILPPPNRSKETTQ